MRTKVLKKCIALVTALILALVLASCGGGAQESSEGGKIKIVTTTFPQYDWAREIAGDKADVSFLVSSGIDMHSYQPSAKDMLSIGQADIFIYTGGESEAWVNDALKEVSNKEVKVINLLEVLGDKAKEEEEKEGMQEEEHEHEGEDEHDEEHEGEPETDEHVWMSLRNAEIFAAEIEKALSEKAPESKDVFHENYAGYEEKLRELDGKYKEVSEKAKRKTLLFADRFPFRYLLDDLGLDYYAAFPGCSAETEASFETIKFLAEKVDELKLPSVLVTESSNEKIAKAIIDNTKNKDQKILKLDSMQSVTEEASKNGTTYLSLMEEDLAVLTEALN